MAVAVVALLCLAVKLPSVSSGDYDAIVADVHAKADAIRQVRLEAYSRTDFDHATEGNKLIPPGTPPTDPMWTQKGYQLIGAAMGAQFHGQNSSVRTNSCCLF